MASDQEPMSEDEEEMMPVESEESKRARLNAEELFGPKVISIHPFSPHDKLAFDFFNLVTPTAEAKRLVTSGTDGYPAMDTAQSVLSPEQAAWFLCRDDMKNLGRGMCRNSLGKDSVKLCLLFATQGFESLLDYENGERI